MNRPFRPVQNINVKSHTFVTDWEHKASGRLDRDHITNEEARWKPWNERLQIGGNGQNYLIWSRRYETVEPITNLIQKGFKGRIAPGDNGDVFLTAPEELLPEVSSEPHTNTIRHSPPL